MLEATSQETLSLNRNFLALFIQSSNLRPMSTASGEALARNRQAAFLVGAIIGRHGLWDFRGFQHRIDETTLVHHALIIRTVINKNALGHTNLVGRKTHTIGDIHRLVHICN